MDNVDIELTSASGPKDKIIEIVLGVTLSDEQVVACQPYREYCNEELALLRQGIARQTWQSESMAAKTYEDISFVVATIHQNAHLTRPKIREILATNKFPNATVVGLNSSINLAIRLWLMLNFQSSDYATLRLQARCIDWDEKSTLQSRIEALFPRSRWNVSTGMTRTGLHFSLGPHFTAAFLQRVCRVKIEWTTSVWDHLHLDRYKGSLRIFPYKCHLEQLLAQDQARAKCPIPTSVLRETLLSLDLLFPLWDRNTLRLLKREQQTFHETGSFYSQTTTLTLMDFDHWRDRLLQLHEVLEVPPVSWAQLWRDRRNPQQFWTFWIALFILLLTILSFVTGFVQAWASVKALDLAVKLAAQG